MSELIPENINEEWALAKYLAQKVVDKASGVADDECVNNPPRDVYFIGNLRPRNDETISNSQNDLLQKLSPSAFGAEFRFKSKKLPLNLEITLNWSCYYRLFPTYAQQRQWTLQTNGDAENSGSGAGAAQSQVNNSNGPRRNIREDLFIRFRKISCQTKGSVLVSRTDENYTIDLQDLESNILVEFQRILEIIRNDTESIRLRVAGQQFTIPEESLISEVAYNNFLNGLTVPATNAWNWEVRTKIYPYDAESGDAVLLFQFVNSSPSNEADKTIEPYLFNPKASFKFNAGVVSPFELELASKSFRYDRNLWGKGFNCGVNRTADNYFETTNTPDFSQNRYVTNNTPEAKFASLTQDPIPILREIESAMIRFKDQWAEEEIVYKAKFGESWGVDYKNEYNRDYVAFEDEIKRFSEGINLLEKDADILYAFKLTNEVFMRAGLDKDGAPKKQSWRLFQIVFIVSQIQGIAALTPQYSQFIEERKNVDIIYFPTGGGKTEAYLGTLVFHCFFDRLRGKSAGVTSWIRFPLRLLTIQQTQRLADVIGLSELVRSEQTDKRLSEEGVHPFSVGYYVGAEGTPNEIEKPFNGKFSPSWSSAQDAKIRNGWKRVVTCPSCKTNSISVEFDEEKVKIIHRCSNAACKFSKGVIPVYVVDNELYRYLPTVVVGTIDKLASIGNQRKLSMFFGKVDGICKDHGFFNDKCCQKDCTDKTKLAYKIPKGISEPSLFIQDELHLLKEGLGTFDSHYETFVQTLLTTFGNLSPLKIIASSATIEKYERQVEHLYGKLPSRAKVFPGIGPTNQRSFYAETKNYPQRIFIAILPHNKTLFNSVLEIIEYYHRHIQDLAKLKIGDVNPYGGVYQPGSSKWNDLLNLYYTTLTYFLSGRELESIRTDIDAHINNAKFKNEGYAPLDVKELTGGTSTDAVAQILELLERYHTPTDSHETVLATNMVSHGVDIDRFNCMLFYGIPRQNAEYIQASSRVGRTHIGIVFDCFHPIRERDQSHYAYFTKYHEFLGQLIEPVAINRWSTYGIDKTLPGLFMGVLLQILSNEATSSRNSYYMLNKVSKLFIDGEIDKEQIKTILKTAYCAEHLNDPRNDVFKNKIDKAIDIFFDHIISQGSNKTFVSEAIYPSPMRSLRDIDEPIIIELDSLGSEWATKK